MTLPFLPTRLAVFALGCLVAVPTTRAQSRPARGTKPPSRPAVARETAHVRLWKSDLRGFQMLRVTMLPAGSTPGQRAAGREVGQGEPGFFFNNYEDVPSGQGTLEVFAGSANAGPDASRPLVSQPADFAPGSFVTVLLDEPAKAGDPPRVQIIVDSLEGGGAGSQSAQISIRGFVSGLKDVRVTLGDSLTAQFPTGESFLQMRGLKPGVYPVRTTGTDAGGKPFEWSEEADFRQHHHLTLLIYPDSYGRIRPRMNVDGEVPAEPPAGKQEQR